MLHRWDTWHFCGACGLSRMEAVNGCIRVCSPAAPADLASRQLAAIVARSPLVRLLDPVVERLNPT